MKTILIILLLFFTTSLSPYYNKSLNYIPDNRFLDYIPIIPIVSTFTVLEVYGTGWTHEQRDVIAITGMITIVATCIIITKIKSKI